MTARFRWLDSLPHATVGFSQLAGFSCCAKPEHIPTEEEQREDMFDSPAPPEISTPDAWPYELRHATIEDLDRVVAKLHEFAPAMLRRSGASEAQVDHWLLVNGERHRWRKRLTSPDATVIIAEDDRGVLVGMGYVQRAVDEEGARFAQLGNLYVRRRRQGIGSAIMKARLEAARRLDGVRYAQIDVAATNEDMRRLAQSSGFTQGEAFEHSILDTIDFEHWHMPLVA